MKKMTLQVDALAVETFATGDAKGANSTVHALLATRPQVCDPLTLPPRCAVI